MKRLILITPLILLILALAYINIASSEKTVTISINDPSLNPDAGATPQPAYESSPSAIPIVANDRTTFTSPENGITLQYPADWTSRTPSSPDELLSVYQRGETQRPQSEMTDGVILIINKPIAAPPDLQAWMKQKYEIDIADTMTAPTTYSSTIANNITYQTANVCGLGCSTYYNTIQNNKLYVFTYVTEGPHKAMFNAELAKILGSTQFK